MAPFWQRHFKTFRQMNLCLMDTNSKSELLLYSCATRLNAQLLQATFLSFRLQSLPHCDCNKTLWFFSVHSQRHKYTKHQKEQQQFWLKLFPAIDFLHINFWSGWQSFPTKNIATFNLIFFLCWNSLFLRSSARIVCVGMLWAAYVGEKKRFVETEPKFDSFLIWQRKKSSSKFLFVFAFHILAFHLWHGFWLALNHCWFITTFISIFYLPHDAFN